MSWLELPYIEMALVRVVLFLFCFPVLRKTERIGLIWLKGSDH